MLGRCQLLTGARASAAGGCPCAGEGAPRGVRRRPTAAAGPASLGSPAWRAAAAGQRLGAARAGGPRRRGSSRPGALGTGRWGRACGGILRRALARAFVLAAGAPLPGCVVWYFLQYGLVIWCLVFQLFEVYSSFAALCFEI